MSIEDMQDRIRLTKEQQKAWNRLVRAHNDFIKAGGEYYCNLDSINAYNSKYIAYIENGDIGCEPSLDVSNYYMPRLSHSTFCSFADDTHIFILNKDM